MAITLFETVELREGCLFAWRRHLDRLTHAAMRHGLGPPDGAELTRVTHTVAAAWGPRPGRLRVTWTDAGPGAAIGPGYTVHASTMVVRTDPIDVVVAIGVHDEHGVTSGLKTARCGDAVGELHRAASLGAGEALVQNTRGELCEAATSNVVVLLDGELCTPPLDSGCLAGVTRALLLEASAGTSHELTERTMSMHDLDRADELALVSTGRHLQPVRSIDGRALARVDGPAIRALRRSFHDAYADVLDP